MANIDPNDASLEALEKRRTKRPKARWMVLRIIVAGVFLAGICYAGAKILTEPCHRCEEIDKEMKRDVHRDQQRWLRQNLPNQVPRTHLQYHYEETAREQTEFAQKVNKLLREGKHVKIEPTPEMHVR